MDSIKLKNRKDQKIVGLLTKPEGDIRGTAVIQHGWSGKKEQKHVVAIQDAFIENGWQTFNFDTTKAGNLYLTWSELHFERQNSQY